MSKISLAFIAIIIFLFAFSFSAFGATKLFVPQGGTGLSSVTADSYLKGAGTAALVPRTYSEVKTDLSLNNVENTALSTWAGSGNITTLGTIASGIWNGTALTDANVSNTLTCSNLVAGSAVVDISTETNLVGGTGITLTDDTLSCDLGTAIDMSDETNLTAGRSLTESGDSVLADAELYTDTKCIYFEDPTADDDFKSIWYSRAASTITAMWCESDQTVNLDLQADDGTPADVNGADLVCDSTPANDTSMGGDATLAAGNRLDLAITSVSGTPTWVSVCWTFTYDD